MKYIILLMPLVMLLGYQGQAQNFKASYVQVLNLNSKPDTTQATLLFNNTGSLYSYGKTAGGNKFKSGPGQSDEEVAFNIKLSDADGYQYYKTYESKAFISRELLFTKPVIITDSVPIINWAINDTATKKVGNLTCKKATGSFRGRTYNVWFTEDIPVVAGPWKLGGLPGLIVEATDTEKQVSYTLASVGPTTDAIKLPTAPRKMTESEFVAAFKKRAGNLAKYLKSSVQPGGGFETTSTLKLNTLERSLFSD
jgi:GLPGLI family protein